MNNLKIKDIAIIGAGPVGIYAAFYAGLRGMEGFLIESGSQVGGQAMIAFKEKEVLDLPGHFSLKGKEVIKNLLLQYQRFEKSIKLKTNFNVIDVKKTKDYFTIISKTGEKLLAKTICLAVGPGAVMPVKLKLENEQDLDVTYLVENPKTFHNKNLVIFGGGNSALDWAKHFAKKANVSLVHRRSVFRGNESTLASIKEDVKIFNPYKVKEITNNQIFLEKLKTKEELILDYEKIIVQYGLRSVFGAIKNWNLEWEKGKIKVDAFKKTNIDGIWAIGNACYYEGKNYIITTGLADAIVAITSIAKFLNPNALETFYSTDFK